MLKQACLAFGLIVAFCGFARAEQRCDGPWLTPAQLSAISEEDRTSEFQRLLSCTKEGIAQAQALAGRLYGLNIDSFANGLVAERDRLGELLASRTTALNDANAEIDSLVSARDGLTKRIAALTAALDHARTYGEESKAQITALAGEIATLAVERDRLTDELTARTADLVSAREEMATLTEELDALKRQLADATMALEEAHAYIASLEDESDDLARQLDQALADLDNANAVIADLKRERDDLIRRAGASEAELQQANARIAELEQKRDQLKHQVETLTTSLDNANAQIAQLMKERDDLAGQVKALNKKLDEANTRIAALEDELKQAKATIADITAALGKANARIVELEGQLKKANETIAKLMCERDQFAGQRSEFFASLLAALGNTDNVRIVGDRFVFNSDVLFAVGSADLNPEGREEMLTLAKQVAVLQGNLPQSVHWVLQVNGHADRQPIRSKKYPSNWELSAARALTVVRFLETNGVKSERLAAAGFGQFQPINPEHTQAAYKVNRRIELKLTDDGPYPPGVGAPLSGAGQPPCPPVATQ